MSKRLDFFGSGFILFNYTSSILVLYFLRKKRVRNKNLQPKNWSLFAQVQTNVDGVGGKRGYSRNILQWSTNDFKSRISTNGDYFGTVQGDARFCLTI